MATSAGPPGGGGEASAFVPVALPPAGSLTYKFGSHQGTAALTVQICDVG